MLKSELLGSSVGEKPPSELERGDEAAFSDRIGGERGIDRERRTKVLHPSRGWEYPDRAGMAKTEIVTVRQALDYSSTGRAVGVCLIGWLVNGAILYFLGFILLR